MSYCYVDVSIGGAEPLERIVFKLYDDVTPKTCENFRALCAGTEGVVPNTQIKRHYKGCVFHRVVAGFCIQTGDYTSQTEELLGTGGECIWGKTFDDENFKKPCDRPGLLCMANRGKNTNSSQWFITLSNNATHLTGKHCVFGEVASGMNSVRAIEHTKTLAGDKPAQKVVIVDCGVLDKFERLVPADGDVDPDYPDDLPAKAKADESFLLEVAEKVRKIGNDTFAAGKFAAAIVKYEKALRYLESIIRTSANSADIDTKKVACFSNSALCFLKQGKNAEAQISAGKAVVLDKTNVKAMFRRGQASANLQQWELAETDFKKIVELDPSNADAAANLKLAQEQQKAAKEKLARGLRKMFD